MIRFPSRRRLSLATVLLIALIAVIFHRHLLRAVAYPVTHADQPSDEASHVLFLRSAKTVPAAFDYAAEFAQRSDDHRIMVLRDFVRRSEAIGAAASFVGETIELLIDGGVPATQIETIGDGQIMTMEEQLSYAADWLAQQDPEMQLHVLTRHFEAGFVRTIADGVISEELRSRVHVLGFERAGVNATNWWKSSSGLKWCIRADLRLIHLHMFGDHRPEINWDPDRYEASLRKRLTEELP